MIGLKLLESGEELSIDGACTIGRHPDCELQVDDPTISSRHAVIERRDGAWAVRDLGSSNGTSVNGRRIKAWRRLGVGDVIRFAGIAVEVHGVDDRVGSGLPTTRQRRSGPAAEPVPYEVVLTWTGPAEGIIEVGYQGERWRTESGMPFVLLDLLARAGGDWVADGELKSKLWGRRGATMSRSALHTLIYNTRHIFYGFGLDGLCIEKERGQVRLAVASVERVAW
ncbi:MAG: FHA domain-containing protein [Deltaproteobacteria bacterium]|nr:FHA domain-containing protein [Deltaproteobacteria bacterium]